MSSMMAGVTAFFRRIDDWVNPIVIKELRQAVKSRMVVSILMLFLGLQLLLLGLVLISNETRRSAEAVNWYAGAEVFRVQQGVLLWVLAILVPAYAAVRLGAERSDQNVDLLFISTLHPSSIVWGKFVAALMLAVLVFSTCAPFMTFTYLLRGIDLPTIFVVLGIDLLAMLFGTMAALLMASVPGGRMIKFVVSLFGFILLAYAAAGLTAATTELITMGAGELNLGRYWGLYAVGVLAVLGVIGLMYLSSVSLISSPSSNRNLGLRAYAAALWLAVTAGVGLVVAQYRSEVGLIPVGMWLFFVPMLTGLMFLVSICERESWGPRVARTIPRAWHLRLAAWLFYTGSGGGITYCAVLTLATFVIGGWLLELNPGERGVEQSWGILRVAIIATLYGYCYGVSAVLLRSYAMARQVRPGFTWVVMMLLVGLGSSVPAAISFILSQDRMRPSDDVSWWMVPNPFVALYQTSSRFSTVSSQEFAEVALWSLGCWAVGITLAGLPWYARQLERFRPQLRRSEAPLRAAIVETAAPRPAPSASPSPAPQQVPFVTPGG